MIKRFYISSLFLILFFVSFSQDNDEQRIRTLLAQQTAAWNKGNLKQFMNGYWKSDSLMFIGKSGITYGWQNTLDNYKKNYKDTVSMGKLKFDLKEFKKIDNNNYFVVGGWQLIRTVGNLNGIFSLLFRKIKNSWVIIADHSS